LQITRNRAEVAFPPLGAGLIPSIFGALMQAVFTKLSKVKSPKLALRLSVFARDFFERITPALGEGQGRAKKGGFLTKF
jgi:hypothetical protein